MGSVTSLSVVDWSVNMLMN